MIRQTEINYWTNRQREMETAARDALKLYRPTFHAELEKKATAIAFQRLEAEAEHQTLAQLERELEKIEHMVANARLQLAMKLNVATLKSSDWEAKSAIHRTIEPIKGQVILQLQGEDLDGIELCKIETQGKDFLKSLYCMRTKDEIVEKWNAFEKLCTGFTDQMLSRSRNRSSTPIQRVK